jgi:hypothetical protein
MKIRRIIVIAGLLVAVAFLASVALVFHWQRSEQTFKILPTLTTAEQRYVHDHVSRGQPFPASVTLRDLVSGGYISSSDARSLDGADVTFYPTNESESNPDAILVRVRTSDGSQIVALADGSVSLLAK